MFFFQHWSNEYISSLGLGVYHTGVEVYGIGEINYHAFVHSIMFPILKQSLKGGLNAFRVNLHEVHQVKCFMLLFNFIV